MPDHVLADVLVMADGGIVPLIRWSLEAVIDFRDVRLAADERRGGSAEAP